MTCLRGKVLGELEVAHHGARGQAFPEQLLPARRREGREGRRDGEHAPEQRGRPRLVCGPALADMEVREREAVRALDVARVEPERGQGLRGRGAILGDVLHDGVRPEQVPRRLQLEVHRSARGGVEGSGAWHCDVRVRGEAGRAGRRAP